MIDKNDVQERLRNYFASQNSVYGWPANRLISDYLLTLRSIKQFYQCQELNLTNSELLAKSATKGLLKRTTYFYLKNAIQNLFSLLSLLIGLVSKHDRKRKIVVFFSLSNDQIIDKNQIRDFISDSKFSLNIDLETLLLIEQRQFNLKKSTSTVFVFDSMAWMYRHLLEPRLKFEVLGKIAYEIIFSVISLRFRNILLLKHLVIDKHILQCLSENSYQISLLTTQSHLQKLPSPFYFAEATEFLRIMFWYSDNSWVFDDADSQYKFDHSRYRRDFIDFHYCWSDEWSDYLNLIAITGDSIPVGSIMFYRNSFPDPLSSKKYDLLIFDVTPGVTQTEYKFYSDKALSVFYSGISSSIRLISESHAPLKVGIKNKREKNRNLEEWALVNKAHIVNPRENLYDLVSSSKMVIGIPLVSPIKIAMELNVAAAYYYPTELGSWELPIQHAGVPIFRDREQLQEWIVANLGE